MSTNFDIQLAKRNFKGNIVIAITDNDSNITYFSQHDVDSGLTVDYSGYVMNASVNGETLDLRDVKTTIATLNFSLLDKDEDISTFIAIDDNALMNYKVEFYYGFITGSYGWADYKLINTTRITGLNKTANKYSFSSKAPTSLLQERIYTTETFLTQDHTDAVTTITVDDTTDFSSSGTLVIEDEFIPYTGKTATTFTGCTRGSEAASHDEGAEVYEATLIEDESMNLALDIIQTQVGVASALIDTTSFTDLRDDEFSADGNFKLYVWNIESALTWLEDNILRPTNTRLVNRDGKISCRLLDTVAFAQDSESITENHTIGNPSYRIDVNKVVNKVNIKYDYNWDTRKFESLYQTTDATSISRYGEREALNLEYKGVTTTNNGITFASGKARKLLARLSIPRAEIEVKTFFNRFNIEPADQIYLENRFIPQGGTGGDFNSMLEVLSKSPSNFKDNPVISFKLAFTSSATLRYGLISPSPLMSSVVSQSVFTVPDGTKFKVGYYIRLWNDATGEYYADAARAITDITGNQITVASAFSTSLTTSVRITFPDFGDATSEQKEKYAWVGPNTNLFADGSKVYQILP